MKKGKLLNFEFLIDTDDDVRPLILEYLSKKFKEFKLEGVDTVLGLLPMEGLLPWDQDHCEEHFAQIKKYADECNLRVVLVSGLGEEFKQLQVPFDYIFTPYMLRLVFNNYTAFNLKPTHNFETNKFLFLGGVPTRYNRILLLSKLYENNLLESAVWSFFYPSLKEDQDLCKEFLGHYSEEEYNNFINTATRSIDQKYQDVIKYFRDSEVIDDSISWNDVPSSDFWKNPIYIDPEVFRNTSFSIISEGPNFWSNDYGYITEKTWRTILYKHAFIFAGHPDQFRYLKKLGFKTFEEYLPIKNYALIDNEIDRLDAIVKNVKFLTENDIVRKELTKDVDYNFNHLLALAANQNTMLNQIKNDYSIDDLEFKKHFNTLGFENTKTDANYD